MTCGFFSDTICFVLVPPIKDDENHSPEPLVVLASCVKVRAGGDLVIQQVPGGLGARGWCGCRSDYANVSRLDIIFFWIRYLL